jgi:hypothetical protein
MAIYNKDDYKVLADHMDDINERVDRKILNMYLPTKDERKAIITLILNFIKEKKRKIYGGYAMNQLIIDKSKEDGFYKDYQTPDIDFYSPTPIQDLIELCNKLNSTGFQRVQGTEAAHSDTYSIFVNFENYCDISYVPKNIYNKMPFKPINDYNYTHPSFITIDFLRMITDPLASYFRIEKSVKRLAILHKHYPLPVVTKPIQITEGSTESIKAVDVIMKFLFNRKSCITLGFYAYNYFLYESGILESKDKYHKIYNILDIPYFEFISTDYKNDFTELMEKLKQEIPSGKFTHTEYYPFFQFTGYSVEISLDNDIIAIIHSHNNKCTPYQEVQAYNFSNKKVVKTPNKITIGTFTLNLLYAQVNTIKYRVVEEEVMKNIYITMVSHLLQFKKYFFDHNKKDVFSETAFKDFVIDCIGTTKNSLHPDKEKFLKYEERKKKNKVIVFRYDPSKEHKDGEINFRFGNTSGNLIINKKNLKLTGDLTSDDEDDEDEVSENK